MIITDRIDTALNGTSRATLEAIFDASVFDEYCALTFEEFDEPALGETVHRTLLGCGAQTDGDGTYTLPSLEVLQALMNAITARLEDDATEGSSHETLMPEFVVFDAAPWEVPDSLAEDASEPLELGPGEPRLISVPFDRIRLVPANNPRRQSAWAGIMRLARSIARRGLIQPVTVRPDSDNESELLELVFGYRRITAIGCAIRQGWLPSDYPVVCLLRQLNDSQVRLASLTENEEREEVDLLEQAEGWAKLRLTQTESGIADAASVPLTAIKRCLKIAFGVCEEAKALYRSNDLTWEALIALSYGSLELQRRYLEEVGTIPWRLRAEHIKQAMQMTEFKLANARFTLEEYEAAGGEFETDLWQSTEGTRLLSPHVIANLQSAWIQRQADDLKARGFAFVELRSGDWTWWSEFNRVPRDTEGAGAIIQLLPNLSVDVIEFVQPLSSANSASSVSSDPAAAPGESVTPEKRRTEFSEAGVTLIRRTRTAALQEALLENSDPKLPLALAIMGFLGEREVRIRVNALGETDMLISQPVLAELEAFSERVPNLSFSPSSGLELGVLARSGASGRIEVFEALLRLPIPDLERLHRVLVATMIGDFAVATEAMSHDRRRKLTIDGFISALAQHLGVKGGEALEVDETYLKTISYRKAKLQPYLARAFGEQLAVALLESPKTKVIAELLEHKEKLGAFTPPELDFSLHGTSFAQLLKTDLEVDDFSSDAPDETIQLEADLVNENELDFLNDFSAPTTEVIAAFND
jgi:ParB/RepB/Spo0J family partition protein